LRGLDVEGLAAKGTPIRAAFSLENIIDRKLDDKPAFGVLAQNADGG